MSKFGVDVADLTRPSKMNERSGQHDRPQPNSRIGWELRLGTRLRIAISDFDEAFES